MTRPIPLGAAAVLAGGLAGLALLAWEAARAAVGLVLRVWEVLT